MVAFRYGAILAALLIAAPVLAQTAQEGQANHPGDGAPATAWPGGSASSSGTSEPEAPSPMMKGTRMMGPGMEEGSMRGPGMMGGEMMGMRRMMGMMSMMGSGMAPGFRHLEGRLAFLKTELKISDGQMPQWNAFANAERANAKAMSRMHQQFHPGEGAPNSLPERLTLEEKGLTAHLDAFRKTAAALDELYKVLTPGQKKVANEIVIGPMGMPIGMM